MSEAFGLVNALRPLLRLDAHFLLKARSLSHLSAAFGGRELGNRPPRDRRQFCCCYPAIPAARWR